MHNRICRAAVACGLLLHVPASAQQPPDADIDRDLPALVSTYKMLHAAPELSHYEAKTSALVARELRSLGYVVTENVGKYARPDWKPYGVVGILKNGAGPTVLVRTDLDALPVEEKTGLPYASTVKARDDANRDVGVMHACGHDLHITSFLGTARRMAGSKGTWAGTLMLVAQPAEETIDGARAMMGDELYARFGKPDYVLALHANAEMGAGTVGYTAGYFLASANTVEITVRGVGGHGSRPEAAKDPVVLAAQIVLALQTVVSRENSPLDPAVISVGSIHGGTKANIIPDEVRLQLTVRAYKEEVRERILASIDRIASGLAVAAGVPPERRPLVEVSSTESAPATYNNPELTDRLAAALRGALGDEKVVRWPPIMSSEDFGRFAMEGNQIPAFMFWLGAADPAMLAERRRKGLPAPGLHSSLFAPVPEPAIRTGVRAMTATVMSLVGKTP